MSLGSGSEGSTLLEVLVVREGFEDEVVASHGGVVVLGCGRVLGEGVFDERGESEEGLLGD